MAVNRRAFDMLANAYYDGFVEATKHRPWDDMFDWAALKGQQYARDKLFPAENSASQGEDREAGAARAAALDDLISSSAEEYDSLPQPSEPSAAEKRLTAATCTFAEHIDRDGVGWSRMRHDDVCAVLGEIERLRELASEVLRHNDEAPYGLCDDVAVSGKSCQSYGLEYTLKKLRAALAKPLPPAPEGSK